MFANTKKFCRSEILNKYTWDLVVLGDRMSGKALTTNDLSM